MIMLLKRCILPGILVVAAIFVYVSTQRWGVGMQTDAIIYLDVATSLANKEGFLFVNPSTAMHEPLYHFPPGYPIALAFVARTLSVSPLVAARWLGILLLPVLLGFIWHFAGGNRSLFAMPATMLMAFSTHLVQNFSMAQSEALFLVTVFSGFYCINQYFRTQKYALLIAAGFALGCSFVTRYVGVAAMFAGGMHILLTQKQWQRKVFDAAVYSVIALIPSGAWMIWRFLHARELGYTSAPPALAIRLSEAYQTVGFWLLPGLVPESIRSASVAIAIVLLCAVIVWLAGKEGGILSLLKNISMNSQILLLFVIAYSMLLIITTVLVGNPWPFDERILLPIQCCLVCQLARISSKAYRQIRKPLWQTLIIAIWIGFIFSYSLRVGVRSKEWRDQGLGITAKYYQQKDWDGLAKIIPQNLLIYTDQTSPVFWYLRRATRLFPTPFLRDNRINRDYEKQMNEMLESIVNNEAVCVLLSPLPKEILGIESSGLRNKSVDGFEAIYISPILADKERQN